MRLTRGQKLVLLYCGGQGRNRAISGALDLSEMTALPAVEKELVELARMLFHMTEGQYQRLYCRVCSEYPKKYIRDFEDDPEDYEEDMWN